MSLSHKGKCPIDVNLPEAIVCCWELLWYCFMQ